MGLGLGNTVNTLLKPFGRKVVPFSVTSPAQRQDLQRQLDILKKGLAQDYPIYSKEKIETGEHETSSVDTQCGYMARVIAERKPGNIIDFGSYRHFICGLAAAYNISTVDVRERAPSTPLETVITADCVSVPMVQDESYDMVLSQQLLQHPGLGRYGDAIDVEGHLKTIGEWKRILKPGGHLLFSTTLNAAEEALVFNCHRIYTRQKLHEMCGGLELVEEHCCPRGAGEMKPVEDATSEPGNYDYYVALWQKPLA